MEENQILIDQVNRSVENYLKTVMKLSDSLYYSIIKMQTCQIRPSVNV